jgi:hypothetical protein
MSKFADKLQSLSKASTTPIGFRSSTSVSKSSAMLLIAGLSGTQVKEAKIVADVNADAGLILSQSPSIKIVRQMVEATGDIPLGVFVSGIGDEEINKLEGSGCDFVIFDIKASTTMLHKEGMGKFLMIEPSLDQGFARAINSLAVDGVLISSEGKDSFIDVKHLLVCRRFVELLEKPVMTTLTSLITKAELTNLWEAGVNGLVVTSTQSVEALAELKKMIGNLPIGARGRRAKADVKLPHYGGLTAREEDEDEEQEDI